MRIDIKHYAIPSPGVRGQRRTTELDSSCFGTIHQDCISDNLESIPFEEMRTVWITPIKNGFFVSCCGMLLGDRSHEFCSALTPSFHPVARRSTLISGKQGIDRLENLPSAQH